MFGKIIFVTSKYGGIFPGLRNSLKRMKVDYKEVPIWNMQETYEKFKPQIIIFFHHFLQEWNEKVIKEIESISCHKMLWDFESPWEIDYLTKYHHSFSYVLVQDKNSVKYLNDITGSNKFIHVPHAADPQSCRKLDVPFEYRSDLCFIGAAYPSRLKFFREILPYLKDYKVVIGGTGWEFLPDISEQKIINTGLGEKEYMLYTQGAKIVLNLHRLSDELTMTNDAHITASSPNNRFFEVNMMGAFQMVDNVRDLTNYYPRENLAIFDAPETFLEMYNQYIRDDENRKRIAEDTRLETLKRHKYENRFTEIISKII